MFSLNTTRSICVSSGKGGVGKTTMATNLAYYLSQQDRKVLIFDGDMGMSNVELMLQVQPRGDISEVLSGKKMIEEIITPVTDRISLISGGMAIESLQNLDAFQRKFVLDAFSHIEEPFDDLIIDTSPGLNDNVLYLNSAAQENIMVITPEPTSLSDAYALIKTLNQRFRMSKFTILCNQVKNEREGLVLYEKFADVVSKFLTVGLDYMGSVQMDPYVRHSVSRQALILKQFPDSDAAQTMVQSFEKMKQYKELPEHGGGLDFFWNQIVSVA